MGYPKYLPRKDKYQFRINHDDLTQLKKYAEIKDITTTSIITNLIHDFLEDKVLTNDYMPNKLGFIIRLPLDLEVKRTLLNKDLASFSHTDEFARYIKNHTNKTEIQLLDYESDTIPNNCDVWLGDTFGSTIKGVKHEGILTLITPQYVTDDLEAGDLVYFLDIKILDDDTYKIINVDYLTALNKLKKANNFEAIKTIKEVMYGVEEALASDDCMDSLWSVANQYNTGEMREKTVTLQDKYLTEEEVETEVIRSMIMDSGIIEKTINDFKANEEFMAVIRKKLDEHRKL